MSARANPEILPGTRDPLRASREEYRARLEDPSGERLPSTRQFREAVESGEARADARIFDVLKVSD